jgi:hypothetical protein
VESLRRSWRWLVKICLVVLPLTGCALFSDKRPVVIKADDARLDFALGPVSGHLEGKHVELRQGVLEEGEVAGSFTESGRVSQGRRPPGAPAAPAPPPEPQPEPPK